MSSPLQSKQILVMEDEGIATEQSNRINKSGPSPCIEEPSSKRQRKESTAEMIFEDAQAEPSLPLLCMQGDWTRALQRALEHPGEAAAWTKNSSCSSSRQQHDRRASVASTPLALACRLGAPYSCIKAILQASPEQLRNLIPSYGTPLHEAIVCSSLDDARVIELLLKTDEQLGGRRAALTQDVDGHTPLHLLIRRRFGSSAASSSSTSLEDSDNVMDMLQFLVQSCPEAVEIPDCGEYEEPPLVMALKASLYSSYSSDANNNSQETDSAFLERRILKAVRIMLEANPTAAGKILTGARGPYTALHSAVFHGRCSDTIELLLQTSSSSGAGGSVREALLLNNTQGELPLHFCAMRGEPPRTISLLAQAAPSAVFQRDASGLTPMHWLWIRFVSSLQSIQEAMKNNSNNLESVSLPAVPRTRNDDEQKDLYCDWSRLPHGEFDFVIKKLDPPVDFLRMRHIPPDLLPRQQQNGGVEDGDEWANCTARTLLGIRTRFYNRLSMQQQPQEGENERAGPILSGTTFADQGGRISETAPAVPGAAAAAPPPLEENVTTESMALQSAESLEAAAVAPHDDRNDDGLVRPPMMDLTRQEAVSALFWTKAVSLLRAAHSNSHKSDDFHVTHAAMATVSCPPSVVRIVTTLFPSELSTMDSDGMLPLHYAASRHIDSIEESLAVLQRCMEVSPPQTARVVDRHSKRLVLHHAIDSFVKACSSTRQTCLYWAGGNNSNPKSCFRPVENMLAVLKHLLKLYPDSLERRDGNTKLYPFLQATAAATEYKRSASSNGFPPPGGSEDATLSIVYLLLRERPSLVKHYHE